MKPQTRNSFFASLVVLAVVGVGFILATMPRGSSNNDPIKIIKFKQQTSAGEAEREVILRLIQTDVVSGARYSIGSADAKITMTEFSDFQCSLCGAYATLTEPLVKTEYVDTGKLRLYYRDMPLPQHPHARVAARFVACANEQTQFNAMKDIFYRGQLQWSQLKPQVIPDQFLKYASSVGVDISTFTACTKSTKNDAAIESDYQLGQSLKLEGTPSFVINGYLFSGALPIEGFRLIFKEFGL